MSCSWGWRTLIGLLAKLTQGGNHESPPAREKRATFRRANRGRLPEHLPRVIEPLVPAETVCPCCKGELHEIGVDESQGLDIVPARYQLDHAATAKDGLSRMHRGRGAGWRFVAADQQRPSKRATGRASERRNCPPEDVGVTPDYERSAISDHPEPAHQLLREPAPQWPRCVSAIANPERAPRRLSPSFSNTPLRNFGLTQSAGSLWQRLSGSRPEGIDSGPNATDDYQ